MTVRLCGCSLAEGDAFWLEEEAETQQLITEQNQPQEDSKFSFVAAVKRYCTFNKAMGPWGRKLTVLAGEKGPYPAMHLVKDAYGETLSPSTCPGSSIKKY